MKQLFVAFGAHPVAISLLLFGTMAIGHGVVLTTRLIPQLHAQKNLYCTAEELAKGSWG